MSYGEHGDALASMWRRATLIGDTDDRGTQQLLKKLRGLASEEPEDVYRPQWHGLSSHPPKGSEGLLAALGGRADRWLALGFEHKDHRPKETPPGGTVLYDAHGKVIRLFKDELTVDAGGKPVTIKNASSVKIEADTTISIGVKNGRWIKITPNRVFLGGKSPEDEPVPKVMTDAGASDPVRASID